MKAFISKVLYASCFLLAMAGGNAAGQGAAAGFPTKPIRLIVPFSAGGPADAIARAAAMGLSNALGQPVIVDNRVGAGGRVGAEAVARAAPDGYTLLLCNVGDAMAVSLYKSLPYNFVKDFRTRLAAGLVAFLDRGAPFAARAGFQAVPRACQIETGQRDLRVRGNRRVLAPFG